MYLYIHIYTTLCSHAFRLVCRQYYSEASALGCILYVCTCVFTYIHTFVCMYLCMYASMYAGMHSCLCACMYVWMKFIYASGGLRDAAVLSIVSDQGLTKASLHMMYTMKLRCAWFPGVDHQEANCDKGIFSAINMGHCTDKALFMNRLYRGPKKSPGRWHGKIRRSFKVQWLI